MAGRGKGDPEIRSFMSVRSMKMRLPKRRGCVTPAAASQVLEELNDITTMGILYLFVLAIAAGVGAVLGGCIGLTIGLMSAPLTYAFFGLVAGGFFGLIVGLIFVIRVHQHYLDAWRRR
jgi:hypothetical protein